MRRPPRYAPRTIALYFLAWTVFGLFFSTQDLTRKFVWRDPTPG